MGVSINTANPQEFNRPATAVPGTGAQSIAVFTAAAWCQICSVIFTYVATVTTGGITPTIQFVDAAGNVIYQTPAQTAIAAGTTGVIELGSGLPASPSATFALFPLPSFLFLPPGGKILFNGSPAAATDTLAANVIMSF